MNKIQKIFNSLYSKKEACIKLGFKPNSYSIRKVNKIITEFNIDISHFNGNRHKRRKYKQITKICPVCNKKFKTSLNSREKTTCSYSCSNTFFRSNNKNGNYKHGNHKWGGQEYRRICFSVYKYKCALCEWDKVVEVHHIDGNNKNNDITNLIPLCPNHHRLTLMNNYKDEIEKDIQNFKSLPTGCSTRSTKPG